MSPPPLPRALTAAPAPGPSGRPRRGWQRRLWATLARRWRWVALGAGLATLGLGVPRLGGWVAGRVLAARIEQRLGLPVQVQRCRLAWSGVVDVEELSVAAPDAGADQAQPPLLQIARIEIPLRALRGAGTVRVLGPRLSSPLGAEPLRALRARLLPAESPARGASGPPRELPEVSFQGGVVSVGRVSHGPYLFARDVSGRLEAGRRLTLTVGELAGALGPDTAGGAGFGAEQIDVELPLRGLRPLGMPSVAIEGGYLQATAHLGLSGITGRVRSEADGSALAIELRGSYGGARETLWQAEGTVRPGAALTDSAGQLSLRAERFELGRIREVLPPGVLDPERTSVDAQLALGLADGRVSIAGGFRIGGLSVFHAGLASDPVRGLDLAADVDAAVELGARRVQLARLTVRAGELVANLSGELALGEGSYRQGSGRELPWVPRIDLNLTIPRLTCKRLLSSFPPALVPYLQGFELKGDFQTQLALSVDFANLDALALKGKVGIDGCRVTAAPAHVLVLADPDGLIAREVQVPPRWNDPRAEPETQVFLLGPDNEEFVPYDAISPHLVHAVLTTEDSRFFQHDGFAVAEFRTALRRNLAEGGFRLGASSITMQTVKNLLLSHEKTLSRKLQELFLVWYVEQILSKERILELYFNAIEYGPRLYGIGPAMRHYFGKVPRDATPAEAAFIATLLPSPKRRYAQYCRGALTPDWQRYVRRVLTRMNERGRLTDEEYQEAIAAPPLFDVSERGMDEKSCLEWVRRITSRPEEPAPDPVEVP